VGRSKTYKAGRGAPLCSFLLLPSFFELLLKSLIFFFQSSLARRGESGNYFLGTLDLPYYRLCFCFRCKHFYFCKLHTLVALWGEGDPRKTGTCESKFACKLSKKSPRRFKLRFDRLER